MVLQADMTGTFLGKARKLTELTLSDQIFQVLAAPYVLEDLDIIEPVLDMVSIDDDSKLVVLPDGLKLLARGCNEPVEGSR